jgi:DNA-binding transcriptional regulator LsrR (DeoR family)
MTTILSRGGKDGVIPRLTEALDRTNASRRIGRRAMIRLALSEGMTTKQLSARLGISRQLVERHRDER